MIAEEDLLWVARSQPPVLTVYLNTMAQDPSRHPTVPPGVTWFRREAKAMSRASSPREANELLREVQRVEEFLEGRHPQEKALAIFAGQKTWKIVPLSGSVRNEIQWGRPAIGQLFRLLSERKPYGLVVVDHRGARFFLYLPHQLTLLGEKQYDIDKSQWKRSDVAHISSGRTRKAQGPGHDLVNDRVEAQYKHLCAETADQMLVLNRQHHFIAVLVVGPERLVGSIKANFPPSFQERVVSVPEDLGNFSAASIGRRLDPVIARCELDRQSANLEHLFTGNPRAIVDPDEVFARLQDGTLGNLVIADNVDFHLHQCTKCELINRSSDPVCPSCGSARRKVELLEVLPELAAAHSTEVEFVTGEPAQILLAKAGGIAGWVRQEKKAVAGEI